MVDVRPGVWDAPVVQDAEGVSGRSDRRRAMSSSPTAPRSHVFVLCGSSDRARISPLSFGWFARIRCSCVSRRRSYSRRADAPAAPGSEPVAGVAQSTQGTVFEPRS
jgi:hypothetical protein